MWAGLSGRWEGHKGDLGIKTGAMGFHVVVAHSRQSSYSGDGMGHSDGGDGYSPGEIGYVEVKGLLQVRCEGILQRPGSGFQTEVTRASGRDYRQGGRGYPEVDRLTTEMKATSTRPRLPSCGRTYKGVSLAGVEVGGAN